MNYTISQFKKNFPNDDTCLDFIFNARFKSYKCPVCGKNKFYRIKNRTSYNCSCGYQIYPLKGTIFSDSHSTLYNWFFALYLMSVAKNGMSSKELQGVLGTSYKTAWRMGKLIRSLMAQDKTKLSGTIEADETYIGGRRRGTGNKEGKTPVMGIVERGGRIKSSKIQDNSTYTLLGMLKENVKFGSRLITDDNRAYKPNKVMRIGLFHDKICHSKEEYVRGDIYTNTIEGWFGQLKRSLSGTYHSISAKHLQSYVDEFAYKYNHRFSSVSVFEALLLRLCGLPYSRGQKTSLLKSSVVS